MNLENDQQRHQESRAISESNLNPRSNQQLTELRASNERLQIELNRLAQEQDSRVSTIRAELKSLNDELQTKLHGVDSQNIGNVRLLMDKKLTNSDFTPTDRGLRFKIGSGILKASII